MSALGHKRTFAVQNSMSAITPIAEYMCSAPGDVRFVPIADIAPFIRSPRPDLERGHSPISTRSERRSVGQQELQPQKWYLEVALDELQLAAVTLDYRPAVEPPQSGTVLFRRKKWIEYALLIFFLR